MPQWQFLDETAHKMYNFFIIKYQWLHTNLRCGVTQVTALIQTVRDSSQKLQYLQEMRLKVLSQFVPLDYQGIWRLALSCLLRIRQDLQLVFISYLKLKPDLWLKDSGNLTVPLSKH